MKFRQLKAYILQRKHTKEPDAHGTVYSQECYDSVKQQIEVMRGQPVSNNFDRTLPPVGKIIDVTEDKTGILVTIEVDEKIKPKGFGIGGIINRNDDFRTDTVILYELTITDNPMPGNEIQEEE